MQMISENTIDRIIGQFEQAELDYESATEEFAKQQPAIMSFLFSEQDGVLTDNERNFMLYLAIVIWRSIEYIGPTHPLIDPKKISEAEEANWEKMDKAKGSSFRDRLDIFFKNTSQEDLLAFIEDSLTLDEITDDEADVVVTKEGVEPMFVMLKTVVDVLT